MKKIILFATIFTLSLLMAACQPSVDQAKADFCADLGEFAQAQVALRNLDANSTKDEENQAVSNLEQTWNNLLDSVSTLGDVQVDGIQEAFETLKNDISNIPDDATLAESEVMIKQDLLNTLAETQQILTTTCTYGQQ
jgi:gas vesicle protein